MDEHPAVFVRRLESGAESRAGVAEGCGNLVLEVKIAAPERGHVREHPAEGVGLMHEAGGEHALGHRRFPLVNDERAPYWPGRRRAVDASAAGAAFALGPATGDHEAGTSEAFAMPDTLQAQSWETMPCTPDEGPARTAAIGLITLSNDVVIEPEL